MWKEMQTLPPDGRQSETALMIARGVRRLLRARGFSSVTELALTDGRRADIAAVNRDGEVWIVDLRRRVVDVHRTPARDGYATVETHGPEDTVTLALAPEIAVALRRVFA